MKITINGEVLDAIARFCPNCRYADLDCQEPPCRECQVEFRPNREYTMSEYLPKARSVDLANADGLL